MEMAEPLGSRSNVREILEILEVIEATRFDVLPTGWRNRANRAVDHHLGRCGEGGDFVYYDPFTGPEIDDVTAQSRASAVRAVPDDVPIGWEHVEKAVERTPRETAYDYHAGVVVYLPPVPVISVAPAATPFTESAAVDVDENMQAVGSSAEGVGPSVSTDGYSTGETAPISRFLVDAGTLSSNEGVTTIAEMFGFVRGRVSR